MGPKEATPRKNTAKAAPKMSEPQPEPGDSRPHSGTRIANAEIGLDRQLKHSTTAVSTSKAQSLAATQSAVSEHSQVRSEAGLATDLRISETVGPSGALRADETSLPTRPRDILPLRPEAGAKVTSTSSQGLADFQAPPITRPPDPGIERRILLDHGSKFKQEYGILERHIFRGDEKVSQLCHEIKSLPQASPTLKNLASVVASILGDIVQQTHQVTGLTDTIAVLLNDESLRSEGEARRRIEERAESIEGDDATLDDEPVEVFPSPGDEPDPAVRDARLNATRLVAMRRWTQGSQHPWSQEGAQASDAGLGSSRITAGDDAEGGLARVGDELQGLAKSTGRGDGGQKRSHSEVTSEVSSKDLGRIDRHQGKRR